MLPCAARAGDATGGLRTRAASRRPARAATPAVRATFTAVIERLRAAGLYDVFMRRDPSITREATIAARAPLHGAGLTCPLLVDDACSIYPDRPFVCRQYFVTSPPELCVAPLDNPPTEMLARFATAFLKATEALTGRAQYTVPLVLALDCAEENREARADARRESRVRQGDGQPARGCGVAFA